MGSDVLPELPLGDLVDVFDSLRVPVKSSDRKPGPYPYYGASGITDYVDSYIFEGEHLLLSEDGDNLRTRNTPIAFLADGKLWVNNHAHILRGNEENNTKYLCYALQVAGITSYLSGSTRPKLNQKDMRRIPVYAPPLPEQKAIAHILGSLDDKIELNRRMNATLEGMAQALFKSWFIDFDPVLDNAILAGNPIPDELADRAKVRRAILEQNQPSPNLSQGERNADTEASSSPFGRSGDEGPQDNALAAGNPIPDELAPRAEVRKKALANGTTQQGSLDHPTLSDPKSHFPAAFQETESMGWIPEGWACCALTSIYDVRSGLSKPRSEFGSGHPFLSYKDVMNNPIVPPSLSSLVNTNDRERDAYSVKWGDVFLTRTSETQEELGMSSIALCDYPNATFNGFSKRLRPIDEFAPSPEYAAYFFRITGFRNAMTAMSSLSTRASLNNGMLDRLEILMPNQPAIELFTSFVDSLTRRSQAAVVESETLTKLRDTLLPKLISGELRMPEDTFQRTA